MIPRLRRQLGVFYLAVLALSLAVFALGSYVVTRQVLLEAMDDANHSLLLPAATLYAGGHETMRELFHEFTEFTLASGERAAVLGLDGHVLFERGAPLATDHLPTAVGPSMDGRLRALTIPLMRAGHQEGYLYVARSLASERHALAAMLAGFGACAPLLLGVAGLTGRHIARRATRPVEEAIERERNFTRDASHELRTPLSVLQLEVQLTRRTPGLPVEADARLARLESVIRRMSAMVSDLLALAREDAGIHGASLRFSLAELVEEQVESVAELARAREVGVALDVDGHEAPVTGDPTQLGAAVRNLLDNAIRYSPAGSRVEVKLDAGAQRCQVSVRSAGTSLAGEERSLVFERFARTPAGRAANPDGSGLGLAIAGAVAAAHGGAVELLPPDGPGNTFVLSLPVARG